MSLTSEQPNRSQPDNVEQLKDWLDKKQSPMEEELNTNKWLFNVGLCTEFMKNNLIIYGYLSDKNIANVEASIDFENKIINYKLYFKKKGYKALKQIREIGNDSGLWSLFIKKRLLKKYGSFAFKGILHKFVKDLCGDQWKLSITDHDESEYKEEINGTENRT